MHQFLKIKRTLEIIVHAAYLVHKAIVHGLLEKVYEICLCHELREMGLIVVCQMDIPIIYDGLRKLRK